MQNLLFVALLGVVGVLSRYGVDQWVGASVGSDFPVSTFIINALGCFAAGVVLVLGERQLLSPVLQTGLLVGFCGGFTTFSAYALQTVVLVEKEKFASAILYWTLSPLVGLAMVFLATTIFRRALI